MTATYEVSRVTKDQEGSYLCKANSEAGSAEDMLQIIVVEPGTAYPPGGESNRPDYNRPDGRPDYNRPDYNRPEYRPEYRPPQSPNSRPDYRPGQVGNDTGIEVDRQEFEAPIGGDAELKCFIVGKKKHDTFFSMI